MTNEEIITVKVVKKIRNSQCFMLDDSRPIRIHKNKNVKNYDEFIGK